MARAETIEGVLEQVVYANEENGYTVARIQEDGKGDLSTAVGTLTGIRTGDNIQLHGQWTHHPKYGRQFQIESFRAVPPSTLTGMKKYLSSGVLKGVGKKTAERLVEEFGMKTLETIEKDPDRLKEVSGLGKKKIRAIRESWEMQQAQQEVMVFLRSYAVTASQAHRIHEQYGDEAIAILRTNPYQLSKDIFGIGFKTADQIAQSLGIPRDAKARLDTGILYVIEHLAEDGHVCYPMDDLLNTAQEILEVDRTLIEAALKRQIECRELVAEEIGRTLVYRSRLHHCEVKVGERLSKLLDDPRHLADIDSEKAIHWFERRTGLKLADGQKTAILLVLTKRVCVITGGPGVGKTTVVNAILQILAAKDIEVILAAPTGRAAKRLTESTGHEAKTLHRLLRFNPALHRFEADEDDPLEGKIFIIDECSMIDIALMHHFLKALPKDAHLVLVGDADQLPSVGPGNVLRDVLNSGKIEAAHLDVIFRQASRSSIVDWAHAINRGEVPRPPQKTEDMTDLYFVEKEDPDQILKTILSLCTERIPERFDLHPARDVQVLTPMHKGTLGVTNLNRELQEALNPRGPGARTTPNGLHEGDKVMQIRNNYEKDVFNGDIGYVSVIDPSEQKVVVQIDGRDVEYTYGALSEVIPAYSISVHKSQGSEYPAVVLPLVTQHFILLQRNLLYTAITRARQLVVLVGTQRALRIAVRSETVRSRFTGLRSRLESGGKLPQPPAEREGFDDF